MSTLSVVKARARWLTFAAYAVLVVYATLRDLGASAYDDSYFFKRFALNLVEQGVYAWNVQDGPVHGATSPLFGLLVVGVVALTKTHVIAVVRVVNAVALLGCGAALLRAAKDERAGGLILLGLGHALVIGTVRTGMETATTLVLLGWVLLGVLRWRESMWHNDALAAAATVLVYLIRPDAALLPAVTLVVLRSFERRPFVRYLGLLALLLGVWLVFARLYLGTALPLSFHLKTIALHTYGPHMSAGRWTDKLSSMGALVFMAAPLLWVVVRARVWRRRDASAALCLAALALWTYHGLSTHEIMGYRARFYVPGLVALLLAAITCVHEVASRRADAVFVVAWALSLAVAYTSGWVPHAAGGPLSSLPWPTYVAVLLGFMAWLWLPARAGLGVVAAALLMGTIGWLPPQAPVLRSDREILVRHDREVTTTRGVFDVARCLPAGATVYHSEMGITGLALHRMRTVDLAGIVSKDVALHGMRFEQRCAADRPEAIFLPHKNYRALNEEIRASQCFEGYTPVVERSSSPLHVRADLAADFMRCASDVHAWR